MSQEPRNKAGYVVKITEGAFIDMCLNALEAYVISEPIKKQDDETIELLEEPVETYGTIWGSQGSMVDGRTIYTVRKVSIDTSAVRTNGATDHYRPTLDLKVNYMESFFPDWEFLGDFHTHPYLQDTQMVKDNKFYDFSPADKEVVQGSDFFTGFNYRVGLVMALAYVRNPEQIDLTTRIKDDMGVLEFRFSNYRLWLKAHVTYENAKGEVSIARTGVQLEVPCMRGIDWPYGVFGHYNPSAMEHVIEFDDED